jgi:hypothetical protein
LGASFFVETWGHDPITKLINDVGANSALGSLSLCLSYGGLSFL